MKRTVVLMLIAALSLCAASFAEADGVDEAVIDRFTDVWVDELLELDLLQIEE